MNQALLCAFYTLRYLSVLSKLIPMVYLWNWDINTDLIITLLLNNFLVYFALTDSYMSLLSGDVL